MKYIVTRHNYHYVDTSAVGLLVTDVIIRQVVSVSALIWFLPQILVTLTNFGYPV